MPETDRILELLKSRLESSREDTLFPPPVFTTLEGKFVDLDLEGGILTTEFPILERFLNPYQTLQGGMLAAVIDNTLGPLSVLIAPPSVTRKLELTFSAPVRRETKRILVTGRFAGQEGKRLYFSAEVRSPQGQRLVRAKAVHIIID